MRILFRIAATLGVLVLSWPAIGGTLHIRNSAEPTSLDPQKLAGLFQDGIFGDTFEGLVTDAADGSIVPGQAHSWTVSDDGLTWTFALRDDIAWSDGQPVVAGDFVFAMRRMVDSATAAEYAWYLEPIRNAEAIIAGRMTDTSQLGVSAPDDRTVVIELERPTPTLLQALAQFAGYPLPEHAIDSVDFARAETLIGNGPFRIVEWAPGQMIRAEKSETYHGAAEVELDGVVYHYIPDDRVAADLFKRGEFDIVAGFPDADYQALQAEFGRQLRLLPWSGLVWYSMQHGKAPFDNPSVRLALSMAIDRERLGADVTGMHEPAAWGLVPPGVPGFSGEAWRPGWAGLPYAERVERARALLSEAGIGPYRPLKLVLRHSLRPDQARLAEGIAAMWRPLGIEAELGGAEIPEHQQALFAGEFDVGASRWIMDFADASDMLKVLGSLDPINYGHWGNVHYDELLSEAARETDPEKRFALLRQAEALAMAETPVIPLYWMVSRNLVSPKVGGFVDNVRDIHRSRWITKGE